MEKKENILVFDSGIGGVTVLKEIIKILPNENYIYYSDSKNNPYGDKTNKEIIKICNKIVNKFINECKAIVIACNTASAKAAKNLRKKYNQKLEVLSISRNDTRYRREENEEKQNHCHAAGYSTACMWMSADIKSNR